MNSEKVELTNTLSRKREVFSPIKPGEVRIYTCGPTVYDYAHIGNLRAYIFADILRRTLEYADYEVKHVMNITDVGHLQSDADEGEDKMTLALKREGKPLTTSSMHEVAEFYFGAFKDDLAKLNIETPERFPFASDHTKEEVDLIQKLQEKGLAYKTSDGIYFDTKKFPGYGKLGGIQADIESRVVNPEKHDSRDFALWKFDDKLGYDSDLGKGFPGWHIECSAMSMKYLGDTFDIHTGGVDHIPIHHNNEIAQSEGATGKPLANFWIHNEWLLVDAKKMAKSNKNFYTLRDIVERGIDPATFRFWLLMANYRSPVNFTFEALEGAESALKRLRSLYLSMGSETGAVSKKYRDDFAAHVFNDLDTPGALTVVWELLKDEKVSDADKKATLLDFDKVLGLGIAGWKKEEIPLEIKKIVAQREEARKNQDWEKSDKLRQASVAGGYGIDDTSSGPEVHKL